MASQEIAELVKLHPGPWRAVGLPTKKPARAYVIGLVGLPGTGKSTLARAYFERTGDTFYISGENIAYAMFNRDRCSEAEYRQVYDWIYGAIRAITQAGYGVIFDATNNLKKYRSDLVRQVGDMAKVYFAELRADSSILDRRLHDRTIDHQDPLAIAGNYDPNLLANFSKSFEGLDPSEGEHNIVIDVDKLALADQLNALDRLLEGS